MRDNVEEIKEKVESDQREFESKIYKPVKNEPANKYLLNSYRLDGEYMHLFQCHIFVLQMHHSFDLTSVQFS